MEQAARQFIRAIRGRRSQVAFSRRLGYRGNVAAKWEGGHRYPTFGETLRAAMLMGVDVSGALTRFHAASAPCWSPDDPATIHLWLSSLQGESSQMQLALSAGLSRQQVGRVLSGRAQGRLPLVLKLLQAMTGRMPDLIAELVDISLVPAVAREAEARKSLARLAFAHPWSPAARAWLGAQKRVPLNDAADRLSDALGLSVEAAQRLVDAMVSSGAASVSRGQLRPAPETTVEIHATAEDVHKLRTHWSQVTADRVAAGSPDDLFSFNVFAVSRADLAKIREAQRRFYREVRSIVADSPPEVPAMLVIHTAAWSEGQVSPLAT